MLSRGTAYEKSRRCSSVDPTPIMNLPVKLVSGAAYLSLSIGPCVCYASKPNASECRRLSRHQLRRCVPQQRERHDQVWIYWSDGASLTLALAVPAAAGDVQNSPAHRAKPKTRAVVVNPYVEPNLPVENDVRWGYGGISVLSLRLWRSLWGRPISWQRSRTGITHLVVS